MGHQDKLLKQKAIGFWLSATCSTQNGKSNFIIPFSFFLSLSLSLSLSLFHIFCHLIVFSFF
jgi:hypothetical protein